MLAQAFSFHVPDFGSNQVRAMGYQENPATMCESKPRFDLWGSNLTNEKQCIPVFSPPLAYQPHGSDPVDTSLMLVDGNVTCSPGPGTPMHPQLNAPMNASQIMPNESNGAKSKSKIRRSNQSCNDNGVVISHHVSHTLAPKRFAIATLRSARTLCLQRRVCTATCAPTLSMMFALGMRLVGV